MGANDQKSYLQHDTNEGAFALAKKKKKELLLPLDTQNAADAPGRKINVGRRWRLNHSCCTALAIGAVEGVQGSSSPIHQQAPIGYSRKKTLVFVALTVWGQEKRDFLPQRKGFTD